MFLSAFSNLTCQLRPQDTVSLETVDRSSPNSLTNFSGMLCSHKSTYIYCLYVQCKMKSTKHMFPRCTKIASNNYNSQISQDWRHRPITLIELFKFDLVSCFSHFLNFRRITSRCSKFSKLSQHIYQQGSSNKMKRGN